MPFANSEFTICTIFIISPHYFTPSPKHEIYLFTVLPFYHSNNPPLLFNTRALLSNKRPLLNKSCSFHIEVIFNAIISPIYLQFISNSILIKN